MAMAALATKDSVLRSAQLIATTVARDSNLGISFEELRHFFAKCAEAFGQESNGRDEAEKVMKKLRSRNTAGGERYLAQDDFRDYIVRQFSKHPQHLEELSVSFHLLRKHSCNAPDILPCTVLNFSEGVI